MNINNHFLSLVDFLAFTQGILLGILLIVRSKKNRPSSLLGWFLICYSGDLVDTILLDTHLIADFPNLMFLPLNFYFLTLPLLYLYTKSLIGEVSVKRYFWLFLPGLVEFLIFLKLFLLPVERKLNLIISDNFNVALGTYQLASFVFSICCAILIIRLIDRHQKLLAGYYANLEKKRLVWVKVVAQAIIVFYSTWILFYYLDGTNIQHYLTPALSIGNVVFIFWVGISGLLQTRVEPYIEKQSPPVTGLPEETDEDLIDREKERALFMSFRQMVEQEKLYKNADLTLPVLAEKFEVSRWTLSRMINQYGDVNFSRFINEYRVREAVKILCDDNYNHLNMLGIAYEVGFSSKATFFAVFKQITNTSPGNFKKNCNKRNS